MEIEKEIAFVFFCSFLIFFHHRFFLFSSSDSNSSRYLTLFVRAKVWNGNRRRNRLFSASFFFPSALSIVSFYFSSSESSGYFAAPFRTKMEIEQKSSSVLFVPFFFSSFFALTSFILFSVLSKWILSFPFYLLLNLRYSIPSLRLPSTYSISIFHWIRYGYYLNTFGE